MRLDKFLQTTGLIKRRTIANEACKRQLIKVNGVLAKPTREVADGDEIELDLPRKLIRIKLLQPPPTGSMPRAARDTYFTVLQETEKSDSEDSWDS
jgi:ribosomal 50S subunit-recycling heat shock protein